MADRTLSIAQCCELAGVTRRTIYNWLAAGKLKYVRTAGGSVRIFASSLFRDGNTQAVVRTDDEVAHA